MSFTVFDKEKMMKKGTKEGMWAGGAAALAISVIAFLRATEVVPWAEEHDAVAIAMMVPAFITGIKMLRNLMQEMGFTLNK